MAEVLLKEDLSDFESILNNMNYDLKQNIITTPTVPSLQFLMLNKISVKLWKDLSGEVGEYLSSIKLQCYDYQKLINSMEHLENKVLEKNESLIISKVCQEALKPIIKLVAFEIKKYFECRLFLISANWEKLKIYWDNLVFTDEGKINNFKTSKQLLQLTNISTEEKYVIACNNCLEDEIRAMQEEISLDFLNELFEHCKIYFDIFRHEYIVYMPFDLVLFWTFYVRDEQERFVEITTTMSIYMFILKWAIYYNNEVAFQYIWENFADEEIKEKILELIYFSFFPNVIIGYLYFSNIYLYLFKQEPSIPLDVFMVEGSTEYDNQMLAFNLILAVNRVSKICFLPNINRAHELIMSNDIYVSYEIKTTAYNMKVLTLEQYINIHDDIENCLKTCSEMDLNNICNIMIKNFNLDNTMITLTLLIRMIYNHANKEFICGEIGLRFCVLLLKNEKLKAFKYIIHKILKTEENIIHFKEAFYNKNFKSVCSDLIFNERYDFLDDILIYFCSEEERKRFKIQLPYKENAYYVLNIINNVLNKDVDMLSLLNNFLEWCFDQNEIEIKRCKAVIFELNGVVYFEHAFSFCDKMKRLIKNRKWHLLDKYYRWIFFSNKDKISTVEEKLFRIKFIFLLISRRGCYGLIKKFFILSFEENEIEDLKKELKYSYELLLLVKTMLQYDKHEKITELLDWCYSDVKDDIDEFKWRFMHSFGCEILAKVISEDDIESYKVKWLFKWFNPSIESAKKFKEIFINYVKNKNVEDVLRGDMTIWKSLQERNIESLELLEMFAIE